MFYTTFMCLCETSDDLVCFERIERHFWASLLSPLLDKYICYSNTQNIDQFSFSLFNSLGDMLTVMFTSTKIIFLKYFLI